MSFEFVISMLTVLLCVHVLRQNYIFNDSLFITACLHYIILLTAGGLRRARLKTGGGGGGV